MATDTGGPTQAKYVSYSGVGEIRTHGTLTGSAVFKTAAFNHSATTPGYGNLFSHHRLSNPV